jgi:cytochrome c oxidase assembly protein subunit 15
MDSAVAQPSPGIRADARTRPLALSSLLFAVAGLVFAMVVVGGITRLTESGRSITEWNVIAGAVPPLGLGEPVRSLQADPAIS